jgi:serine/threonine protein kinase
MRCRECHADLPAEARFCLSCGARVEAAVPEAPADPLFELLGNAIGFQYRIERLLGRGGMGAVYLAHELALDRDVAIKVLPPEHASTPEVRERFKREARTAARLTHPHIVPLHTFAEVSGLLYFVMGYVAGESLAARIRRQGPFDSEEARTFLASLCDALDYAHRHGIVHRDIKPDNILIEAGSGIPLLTDFGIAKATLSDAQLTSAGQLIGTPHYMSPEQAMGKADVGPRSDLYSLGIVAYEMLSGQRPFEAESPLDALTRRLTQNPRPLGSVADVAPDLAQAVDRCLHRDPADRWPDAKNLRDMLMPTEEEPDFAPPVRVLQTIATIVLPVALIAFGSLRLSATLHPDSHSIARLTGVLVAVVVTMVVVAVVSVVRLRVEGLDLKGVMLKGLQQPSWWRSWYPRFLRRRGDVWDRLPRSMRQFRTFKGLLLTYMFTLFVPLQFLGQWERRLPTLRRLLFVTALAGLSLLFVLRRRAVQDMLARSGGTVVAALLNAPTWRVSIWRRTPAATLLATTAWRPSAQSELSPTVTRLANSIDDDRSTQG